MARSTTVRLLACLMLVATVGHLVPAASAQDASPVAGNGTFEPAACMVALPAGFTEGGNASCGYLRVPLKHEEPSGPTINLAVVKLKSTSAHPATEPLVMLNGGPGGGMEQLLLSAFVQSGYYSYAPFLTRQDVIIFDQRGAGASQPALSCRVSSDATPDATAPLSVDATVNCLSLWSASGLDLTGFRTAESAADVESLRLALGYRQVDLFGVSYGTRLALEVMRNFPASIRSVVLSSPLPPQVDPFAGQLIAFDGALTALFNDCAADSVCNQLFPDLDSKLQRVYDRLNNQGITIAFDTSSTPFVVDGASFLSVLYGMVYGSYTASLIPAFLTALDNGDTSALEQFTRLSLGLFPGLAIGDFYAVICQDEAPFSDRPTASAAASAAGVRPMMLNKKFENIAWIGILGICDDIGLPSSPASENQPVVSEIPTLVFTGEYDPITPPAYGELLRHDLANITLIELPGTSHAPMEGGGACTLGIAETFLANPTAPVATDEPCLDAIFPVFPADIPAF